MGALELVVLLGATIIVGGVLGRRLNVATPVLLLALGVLLGFVPALRQIHLPPELMLLVFLPALLYWEAITSSLREIRANLRGVVLTSTVLVVLTAWAVAAVAHAFGLPWGPAWVLGAALAPTDATAVGALSRLLPRRHMAMLRSEGLVNDGTALVIYGVAVGVTVGEQTLTLGHVTWLLTLSYGGGVLAGLLVAWCGIQVRRHFDDLYLGNAVTLLTPFTAFLVAETVNASGVLAVVVAGLAMGQAGPRVVGAAVRRVGESFWSLGTYLLNAALFVLVGLEVQSSVRVLTGREVSEGVVLSLAVWGTILAVRCAFLFASAYAIRALDRRPSQRLRRVSDRSRIASTVAGFRGAVSLAAALAVPSHVSSGAPFPDRDLIVFACAIVVTLTLTVQGVALPAVVRWTRFPEDDSEARERRLADRTATLEALHALPELARRHGVDSQFIDDVREQYVAHLRELDSSWHGQREQDSDVRNVEGLTRLRLALVAHKRATVIRLRDERRIDDAVLRRVQARLDIEELRLSRGDLNLE